FFHASLTNLYRFRGRAGGFASASGAMLSSGSGAFGVSSAISQPPGFTDSPEGTTPDQGRRKRRTNGARLLSPFFHAAARSPGDTHVPEGLPPRRTGIPECSVGTNWIFGGRHHSVDHVRGFCAWSIHMVRHSHVRRGPDWNRQSVSVAICCVGGVCRLRGDGERVRGVMAACVGDVEPRGSDLRRLQSSRRDYHSRRGISGPCGVSPPADRMRQVATLRAGRPRDDGSCLAVVSNGAGFCLHARLAHL